MIARKNRISEHQHAAHRHALKYEPTSDFPGVDIDAIHRKRPKPAKVGKWSAANSQRSAAIMVERAILETKIIQTAMFDYRRLKRLGWSGQELCDAPLRHWKACEAYERHLKGKSK